MAVAEYFARQAFMACSDGAVQVSKPAWEPFGAFCDGGGDGDGDGSGDGSFVSTGLVAEGSGVGSSVDHGHVPVGGGAGFFGHAGFFALTADESLAEPSAADCGLTWRRVASVCSTSAG